MREGAWDMDREPVKEYGSVVGSTEGWRVRIGLVSNYEHDDVRPLGLPVTSVTLMMFSYQHPFLREVRNPRVAFMRRRVQNRWMHCLPVWQCNAGESDEQFVERLAREVFHWRPEVPEISVAPSQDYVPTKYRDWKKTRPCLRDFAVPKRPTSEGAKWHPFTGSDNQGEVKIGRTDYPVYPPHDELIRWMIRRQGFNKVW